MPAACPRRAPRWGRRCDSPETERASPATVRRATSSRRGPMKRSRDDPLVNRQPVVGEGVEAVQPRIHRRERSPVDLLWGGNLHDRLVADADAEEEPARMTAALCLERRGQHGGFGNPYAGNATRDDHPVAPVAISSPLSSKRSAFSHIAPNPSSSISRAAATVTPRSASATTALRKPSRTPTDRFRRGAQRRHPPLTRQGPTGLAGANGIGSRPSASAKTSSAICIALTAPE